MEPSSSPSDSPPTSTSTSATSTPAMAAVSVATTSPPVVNHPPAASSDACSPNPASIPPAQDPTTSNGSSNNNKEAPQSIVVALRIRPLTAAEHIQGCKDCINVIPGEPQVQLGSNFFTFDHVYSSTTSSTASIYDECVVPLVDALFQGFNATVLAYGQTGSGKTYTMGTGFAIGGCSDGITPRVMEALFEKAQNMKQELDLQLRVSFIEILKEEVHDLLDPSASVVGRSESSNGLGFLVGSYKNAATIKPTIQIRETTNGDIMLAGVREIDVRNLQEMSLCLQQGALCRATGSTNMNSCSSRSHAIFTVVLEQRKKLDTGSNTRVENVEDYLCAKLHLVDLAGSERVKRTGADGLRFKEGVHINKGLLALGNVISALGDERKRKEGGHIPYRDSKLTRLLQDSLGGNSKTVMIACVSPADTNAEETLNTLKYANRARNIQNKPVINRDPIAAEMQRMRQQIEILQAELACARADGSSVLDSQRIAWLDANNVELQRELQDTQAAYELQSKHILQTQIERDKLKLKLECIESGKNIQDLDNLIEKQDFGILKSHLARIQELEAKLQQLQKSQHVDNNQLSNKDLCIDALQENLLGSPTCMDFGSKSLEALKVRNLQTSVFVDEEAETIAKEWEHTVLQDTLDKELQQLNKCLEQKEAEMQTFLKSDADSLRHHFEKKIQELEEEKKTFQRERDLLLVEMETLVNQTDEQAQKIKETYAQKLKTLEHQIADLKRNQESHTQLLRQKQRSDDAAKHLQEEIQRMKAQRVNLMHRIKQEAETFRVWKASRERELFQLKKEGRRNEFEMKKLHTLNQRQKMVLQRKTEEAAAATRRLKELLGVRKPVIRGSSCQGSADSDGNLIQTNERELQHWLNHELEVAVRINEVRAAYEKQRDASASIAKELEELRKEDSIESGQDSDETLNCGSDAKPPLNAAKARKHRIYFLESLLNASSTALVDMAAELSDAEEREHAFTDQTRWHNFQNLSEVKLLLQHAFNAAASARCELHEVKLENNELKNKMNTLKELLKQREICKRELESEQREQAVSMALITSTKKSMAHDDLKNKIEELSIELNHIQSQASGRLGLVNDSSWKGGSRLGAFHEDLSKVMSTGQGSYMRQDPRKSVRFSRWRWSQQWWMLYLRWWQKTEPLPDSCISPRS